MDLLAEDAETLFEGLEKEFANKVSLLYASGCDFDGKDQSGFAAARKAAEEADVILLCLGEQAGWSGENASRSTLALPAIQEQLAAELHKTGKPIILILSNGRPLELCRLDPISQAIVEIWQPGICGGTPLAGILSGRINPSGKLCITFPYSTGQIPIYYNARQSSRPDQGRYQDIPSRPLYEFGYGLSYTDYTYGELKLSATQIKKNNKLVVEIPVTNVGKMDGYETIHWFISNPSCSISRPLKELKHFEKRLLKAGETTIFRFEIDPEQHFSYVDHEGTRFTESGDYYIIVQNKKVKVELVD